MKGGAQWEGEWIGLCSCQLMNGDKPQVMSGREAGNGPKILNEFFILEKVNSDLIVSI